MHRTIPILLAIASTALAATPGFDGRWNISVPGSGAPQAWWMEIRGSDTGSPTGRFTGFWGGDTNDIQKPEIRNNVLHFSSDLGNHHVEYSARLVLTGKNQKLEGERKENGQVVKWTGKRAPEIEERDDDSWKVGKPLELFNRKNLTGWHPVPAGQGSGWSVENGVLRCTGTAKNLVTDTKFWNFALHVEYRILPHSNSGVALRGRYEVQILEDYGKEPNLHSNGSLYSRIAPLKNASKPADEWQTFDIRLVGLDVSVTLNGTKVIEKGHIDGLTAMGFDADEGQPGPLALQGDHGPVEFRRITVTPLTR